MSRAGRRIAVSTSPGNSRLFIAAGAVLISSALGLLPGCVTSSEGEKMHAEIATLKTRLDDIDKRDQEYKEQVQRLRKVLDQATALLTRNSADVGAKVAKSEQDIAALQGRIEEQAHANDLQNRQEAEERTRLETRLTALEQTQTKIVDKVAPTLPDDKDQLWAQAGQRLASGQRDDGRRFYRVFIQRFPQDPRAAQGYMAVGMSFMQESKYANAVAEFDKLMKTYPASPEVPEAEWQLANAYVHLGFCTDAHTFLSDLIKRFPKSPRAAEAKAELKRIAKLPKSACSS
jgi:TolA-binding protein